MKWRNKWFQSKENRGDKGLVVQVCPDKKNALWPEQGKPRWGQWEMRSVRPERGIADPRDSCKPLQVFGFYPEWDRSHCGVLSRGIRASFVDFNLKDYSGWGLFWLRIEFRIFGAFVFFLVSSSSIDFLFLNFYFEVIVESQKLQKCTVVHLMYLLASSPPPHSCNNIIIVKFQSQECGIGAVCVSARVSHV